MNKININKKGIIMLFIIIVLCILAVFISMSKKENDDFYVSDNNEVQNTSNKTENEKQEDNYIYVHIIGEIKNAGIVKLHER